MAEKIDGCVHLIIRNKKIETIYTHINKIPKNGVVHLKGDKIYSFEEFKKSHPVDKEELKSKEKGIFIASFDLPSKIEKLLKLNKPAVHANYKLKEIGSPNLEEILSQRFQ